MSRRLGCPLAMLLALAVFSVAPSTAWAVSSWAFAEAREGEGLNVKEGTEVGLLSKNLVITAGLTQLQCAESELTGTLTKNGPELATAEFTSSRFEAAGGGKCKTSTSGVTAAVTAGGMPWTAEFTENGKATIKGKSSTTFSAGIYASGFLVTTCVYETSAITAEFEFGKALGVVFPSQSLTRKSGSETYCTKSATLSGNAEGGGEKYKYGLLPTPTVTLREKTKTGTALAVNSGIAGSSTNFYVSNDDGSGRVDCANAGFGAKVTNNQKGVAVAEISSTEFNSGKDKWCKSTIKPGGVASRAVITTENTPWDMTFWEGAGSFTRGDPALFPPPKFKEELYKDTDETLLLTCRYEGAWVTTYTLGASLGLTVMPPLAGILRDKAGSDKGCSDKVTIGGTFTVLTSPGKEIVVPTGP